MARNPSRSKARKDAGVPATTAKGKSARSKGWDGVELVTAPALESDLLAREEKNDGSDSSRRLVRGGRFCGSYMMATNGGSTFEDLIRPPPVAGDRSGSAAPPVTGGGNPSVQNVIGRSDDRVLISDTSRIPARSIGLLKIIPEDGVPRFGTAWLIGPRVLATAAHNLLHPDPNVGKTRSLKVGMAYDGTAARGGWHRVCDCAFDKEWRESPKRGSPFDYAVLKIEDRSVGNALGWFGYADYEDAKFGNLVVNIFGYPMDLKQFHMYGAAGRVQDVDEGRIMYDCDAGGGMSGGPVIARFGEQRIAVGVHVAGGTRSNVGTRINDNAFRLFDEHKEW